MTMQARGERRAPREVRQLGPAAGGLRQRLLACIRLLALASGSWHSITYYAFEELVTKASVTCLGGQRHELVTKASVSRWSTTRPSSSRVSCKCCMHTARGLRPRGGGSQRGARFTMYIYPRSLLGSVTLFQRLRVDLRKVTITSTVEVVLILYSFDCHTSVPPENAHLHQSKNRNQSPGRSQQHRRATLSWRGTADGADTGGLAGIPRC